MAVLCIVSIKPRGIAKLIDLLNEKISVTS